MSDTCAYFTYFAAPANRCHGYSSCNELDGSRCFGTCFSGDEICTMEEECVQPGKCENTAVVDKKETATLSDCASWMNRRPDANFFSYDADTQASSIRLEGPENGSPPNSRYVEILCRSVSSPWTAIYRAPQIARNVIMVTGVA